jgi:hypothetical protein
MHLEPREECVKANARYFALKAGYVKLFVEEYIGITMQYVSTESIFFHISARNGEGYYEAFTMYVVS